MRKINKTLLIVGIILVICIIIVLSLLILLRGRISEEDDVIVQDNDKVTIGEKVRELDVVSEYFNLKSCIQTYYIAVANLKYSTTADEVGLGYATSGVDEYYKEAIYYMLLDSYKKSNNITLESIENLYEEEKEVRIFITEALKYSISNNTSIYWVKGEAITDREFEKSEFRIAVIINTDALTFGILPWEYMEKIGLSNVKIGDTIDIKEINYNIEKNDYNTFKYQNSTNETIAREYFDIYQFNVLHNKETAYQKLNEEYSKAKFDKLEDFENYVRNNMIKISGGILNGYQVTEHDDYTQYVCVDNKNRYYIFRAKSILDYDVILDTYTIDIPEFTTRYESVTEQEKTILNLNKFMLALNDKDYKYAYNVLADSFKQTNFPTLNSFEEYVKSNFYNENKFEYMEFGAEAGTYYTYKVNITDSTDEAKKAVAKNFIMLLEEGTDFKISFNI